MLETAFVKRNTIGGPETYSLTRWKVNMHFVETHFQTLTQKTIVLIKRDFNDA